MILKKNFFFLLSIYNLDHLFFKVGAYLYLESMSWYVPLAGPADEEEVIVCWETTVIFTVSSFQYLILATVFSKGRPFRKPFYTNRPFLASIIILTVFSIVLTVYPGTALATFFELMFDEKHLYLYFRLALLGMAVTNLIVCYTFEIVIGESRHLKTFCHILTQKKGPKNRFKTTRTGQIAF